MQEQHALQSARDIIDQLNQQSATETAQLKQEQELSLRQQAYELSLTEAITSVQV